LWPSKFYQVSRATSATIAGSEAGNRDVDLHEFRQSLAPEALDGSRVCWASRVWRTRYYGEITTGEHSGHLSKVVDVPVWALFGLVEDMPPQACSQAAWAAGAPQVYVFPGREYDFSQPAYVQAM
jgi:hypothetical protein